MRRNVKLFNSKIGQSLPGTVCLIALIALFMEQGHGPEGLVKIRENCSSQRADIWQISHFLIISNGQ